MSLQCMVCGNSVRKTSAALLLHYKSCSILIPERVKSTTLHTEKAILLGRIGKHSQALQVLVHQEGDPKAAEAFCHRAAQGRDSQFKQSLLLILLQIYLSSEDLISVAADLLNKNPCVFAVEQVIQLLPDSWSVQLVSQFLIGSLRETLHQRRMARLQKGLSQAELMQHKVVLVNLTPYFTSLFCSSEHFTVCVLFSLVFLNVIALSISSQQMRASKIKFRLDKGQKCTVCQKDFAEPHFACTLHGELMHTSCTGFSSSS